MHLNQRGYLLFVKSSDGLWGLHSSDFHLTEESAESTGMDSDEEYLVLSTDEVAGHFAHRSKNKIFPN